MPNQKSTERVDRNGGGDATKASKIAAPTTDKTVREDFAGSRGAKKN